MSGLDMVLTAICEGVEAFADDVDHQAVESLVRAAVRGTRSLIAQVQARQKTEAQDQARREAEHWEPLRDVIERVVALEGGKGRKAP